MNTISDRELADNVKNGAVKEFRIVQNVAGKYEIVVKLAWKEGEVVLQSQRKKAREWASLDRLVRHIRENYNGSVPTILLTLQTEKKDESG